MFFIQLSLYLMFNSYLKPPVTRSPATFRRPVAAKLSRLAAAARHPHAAPIVFYRRETRTEGKLSKVGLSDECLEEISTFFSRKTIIL